MLILVALKFERTERRGVSTYITTHGIAPIPIENDPM